MRKPSELTPKLAEAWKKKIDALKKNPVSGSPGDATFASILNNAILNQPTGNPANRAMQEFLKQFPIHRKIAIFILAKREENRQQLRKIQQKKIGELLTPRKTRLERKPQNKPRNRPPTH